MSSMSLETQNDQDAAIHFNLGVDVLASGSEMGSLPHDWNPHDVGHRQHGAGNWQPAHPAEMQHWAAGLDVPGF